MRILYIDIDSLRPDHLGCYGYHRQTSPHIDSIARRGVRFDRCYTSDAPCLPSRTAFYSGRFGIQNGVVGHGGTSSQPKIEGPERGFADSFTRYGLAGRLQELGLHTAMISPFGQRHSAHWFYAGFHEIHNTGKNGLESAKEIWPRAAKWLDDRAASDNWFLHINLWDPHTPYRAPAEFGEPFAEDPLPAWLNDPELIRRHNRVTGPHTSLDISMWDDQEDPRYPRQPGKVTDLKSTRRFVDGYDTGVRYADHYIGLMIDKLKTAGVYDQTAIIVSADHGENLGELGIYAEHATADDATCHVPLIISWPRGSQGVCSRGLHYQLDLAPTLMQLLGADPSPIWDGEGFAAAVLGGSDAGRDELVLGQCAHVCQRSVLFDRWLYIRTWHDGFHLFPDEVLFDLQADPHEQRDLAATHPDIVASAAARLAEWHGRQMARMPGEKIDPLQTVIAEGGPAHARQAIGRSPLPGYLKRLEATGRADGAGALRKRYAEFLPDQAGLRAAC
jgi:arylsulfatase A-like enzyme